MSKRMLIFDCDGVLVDSESLATGVLLDTIRAAGAQIDDHSAYTRFLGRSDEAVFTILREQFGIDLAQPEVALMQERLDKRLRSELQPTNGIVDVLKNLDYRRCVASSSRPERVRLSLTVTGLLELFDPQIFSASMVRRGKPAPDLFLYAAASAGVAPRDCIVIEDSPSGIRAAQAAGMTVLAFTGGSHAVLSDLETSVAALGPDACFDDMHTLPDLVAELEIRARTCDQGNGYFVQETS